MGGHFGGIHTPPQPAITSDFNGLMVLSVRTIKLYLKYFILHTSVLWCWWTIVQRALWERVTHHNFNKGLRPELQTLFRSMERQKERQVRMRDMQTAGQRERERDRGRVGQRESEREKERKERNLLWDTIKPWAQLLKTIITTKGDLLWKIRPWNIPTLQMQHSILRETASKREQRGKKINQEEEAGNESRAESPMAIYLLHSDYFWPEPYGSWSKVVHFIGNTVPFWDATQLMHNFKRLHLQSCIALKSHASMEFSTSKTHSASPRPPLSPCRRNLTPPSHPLSLCPSSSGCVVEDSIWCLLPVLLILEAGSQDLNHHLSRWWLLLPRMQRCLELLWWSSLHKCIGCYQ